MMKLPDDDGGIFKPTNERLANELYEEMKPIVAALASNPSVINLEKWKECDEYWEWDEPSGKSSSHGPFDCDSTEDHAFGNVGRGRTQIT
jgi:hypothetical protein